MTNSVGKLGLSVALGVMVAGFSVNAATVNDTFDSTIILQDDCDIVTLNDLDFGTHGLITANIDSSSTLSVQCTIGTTYDIGLNFGVNGFRRMATGGNTIFYDLYQDASRTTWWDPFPFGAVGGTGTGSPQPYTIYGRVFNQATPPNGTYTDTITVTVTF